MNPENAYPPQPTTAGIIRFRGPDGVLFEVGVWSRDRLDHRVVKRLLTLGTLEFMEFLHTGGMPPGWVGPDGRPVPESWLPLCRMFMAHLTVRQGLQFFRPYEAQFFVGSSVTPVFPVFPEFLEDPTFSRLTDRKA